MIIIKNTQRTIPCNVEQLHRDAASMLEVLGYDGYELGIWITNDQTIRRYNKTYRHQDKATDILSFPFHQLTPGSRIAPRTDEEKNIGDLIISAPYVHKLYPDDLFYPRLQILLAHGICHLLGHDHDTPETDSLMIAQEQLLLNHIRSC